MNDFYEVIIKMKGSFTLYSGSCGPPGFSLMLFIYFEEIFKWDFKDFLSVNNNLILECCGLFLALKVMDILPSIKIEIVFGIITKRMIGKYRRVLNTLNIKWTLGNVNIQVWLWEKMKNGLGCTFFVDGLTNFAEYDSFCFILLLAFLRIHRRFQHNCCWFLYMLTD